ncbi:MAG: PilZ domain-containing protein [Desulfobacteraceae bacterium]|nr:PilZ domain-containing protein [Desulfobacteraceae bacterium]
MGDPPERRRHPRIAVDWTVQIDVGGKALDCRTTKISAEGIGIICDEPLPIDEVVYLSLAPPDQEPIDIYGKVVWSDVYGIGEEDKVYGIGVVFVQVSRKESSRYDELIQSIIAT